MRAPLLLLLALAVPTLALADAREDGYRARDLSRTTLSPFCPGRTLYDCPSPRAAAWRHDIREWVDEGVSNREIRARLEARQPRATLRSRGPGGLVVIGIFAGSLAALLGVLVFRARRRADEDEDEDEALDDESLDARLDEELARVE